MQSNIQPTGAVDEIKALRTLFEDYLKGILWVENTLIAIFPQMLKHLHSKDLNHMILEYVSNTKVHAVRILQIFESIGIEVEEKRFDAVDSLINELEIVAAQTHFGPVRDAAVIAIVQHIIHCEIASYGTLRSFSITLKEENVVTLLEENLDDEKAFDLQLTALAEACVNDEAANKQV